MLWSMWSVWLVFHDCDSDSLCPLMDKDKRLVEASWWEWKLPRAYWPSICLFWRNVCLDLLPMFWIGLLVSLWLSYIGCFNILEVKSLLVAFIVCKYFLPVHRFSLWTLFIVSFVVQKLISLIRSHLFIFALFLLPWETDPRKHSCSLF